MATPRFAADKLRSNTRYNIPNALPELARVMQFAIVVFVVPNIALSFLPKIALGNDAEWQLLSTRNTPTARHEASLVAHKGNIYLLGGRRINPVDIFDPTEMAWRESIRSPIEIHHFQAVSTNNAIYIVGAMNGPWPNEQPLENVLAFHPETEKFETLDAIPADRRRGGAGAAVYQDKIYVVGGITNGHQDGYVSWFDEYDPQTGKWRELPDAPRARDHFQAVVAGNRLYAIAGRRTSQRTGQGFDLTESEVDVFDFEQNQWLPANTVPPIPTPRAGNFAIAIGTQIWVGGGESGTQKTAHQEVEILDLETNSWMTGPSLVQGRHGTGFALVDHQLYVASGCGNRGGEPELLTTESFDLDAHDALLLTATHAASPNQPSDRATFRLNETIELAFTGPETSENDSVNPFTDYRLQVVCTHESGATRTIRGFYAADGAAANTGAEAGDQWKCRFAPDLIGSWSFQCSLRTGEWIAIETAPDSGSEIDVSPSNGEFSVAEWADDASDEVARDFRRMGRLRSEGHAYRLFPSSYQAGRYWLKGGANSPENLLAYHEFDGTFRMSGEQREGEAKTTETLHRFESHLRDWRDGDPTWGDGKGKALIGACNYLASTGMNSVYFLTMNIGGDGKDVWPYASPNDFTRFDCSRLDQWEIVFEHMQSKGLMLHFITQETENELLLDEGNTDRVRKLYYLELIARFAHHPGVVWDLGEENGPANFSPNGQTTTQQKAMADYFKTNDPYENTVLIHTHAAPNAQDEVLEPLLGHASLDGLALQVGQPKNVHKDVVRWRSASRESNRPWVLTMDEIGPADVGVVPDLDEPSHDSVRGPVLWGSLLGGGSGVEWYFGYKYAHNDLNAEDWRSREEVWRQTRLALDFFREHLPYWEMEPSDSLVTGGASYCLAKPDNVYAVYRSANQPEAELLVDLTECTGTFEVMWFNPRQGGTLQSGTQSRVLSGTSQSIGLPPSDADQDWVALIRKQ